MIAALGFGLIVGALLGLVGGGGSILAVPALVYGVGLSMSDAVPSSLIVVGASSAVAVLPRMRRDVDWRLALTIGFSGALTAVVGTAVNSHLSQPVLLLVFAAIMVLAGVRMLLPSGGSAGADEEAPTWRKLLPKAIGTGLVVGFLTGLLGVGGGFLIVPALTLILGMPMSVAVGTSLVVIVINSLGGFLSHLGDLNLDWGPTLVFAAAAMVASLVAGRLGRSLSNTVLKRGFAVLVLVVAAFVAVSTLVTW
ncbi:sulfite exporter TauE/SafE family protein [Brevibacterium renqingii]|uniref:sulfite exporter TauE/SafE family protein n=1 Tax=Brevibacterium renqingii TaxID=2776916 RepID=UPI001ADF79E3|nr:sulfite exporter TauE/SafE family protein [Brevibacterium renqingii]